jgi:hypothetical protein
MRLCLLPGDVGFAGGAGLQAGSMTGGKAELRSSNNSLNRLNISFDLDIRLSHQRHACASLRLEALPPSFPFDFDRFSDGNRRALFLPVQLDAGRLANVRPARG